MATNLRDNDPQETQEWLDSISAVIRAQGMDRAQFLLKSLINKATESGQQLPVGSLTTPYRNTIPVSEEPKMPGDLYTERAVRAVIRWNALAMVMRANKLGLDLGGHISTFSSSAVRMATSSATSCCSRAMPRPVSIRVPSLKAA